MNNLFFNTKTLLTRLFSNKHSNIATCLTGAPFVRTKTTMSFVDEHEAKIWKYSGKEPGKKIVILGGVHGNEIVGIKVVEHLVKYLKKINKGNLTLALGSLEAIKINKRFFESDLNRCFNPDDIVKGLSKNPTYEQTRSLSLIPLIQNADVVIDIHATNKPSEAFTRIGGMEIGKQHYFYLDKLAGCHILLSDPNSLIGLGKPVCSDELASYNNKIGICYEVGFSEDVTCLPKVWSSVCNILLEDLEAEIISNDISPSPNVFEYGVRDVYELYSVFTLGTEGFKWNSDYGSYNFQKVPKNNIVGFHGQSPLQVECDSYIIFPKVKELWKLGNPLGWLAKKKLN